MPRTRSSLEMAAGKLISAIQHEWIAEMGEPAADASEEVVHTSHLLLQAAKGGSIAGVLAGNTVEEFLGRQWVRAHPEIWPHIQALETIARGAD